MSILPRSRALHSSCIEAGIQMIKIIFDAHPEEIQDSSFAANIQRFHQQVQEFSRYARKAQDVHLMTAPDENGQLPLHSNTHVPAPTYVSTRMST